MKREYEYNDLKKDEFKGKLANEAKGVVISASLGAKQTINKGNVVPKEVGLGALAGAVGHFKAPQDRDDLVALKEDLKGDLKGDIEKGDCTIL